MEKEQIARRILEQCDEPDGVLLELRSKNHFDVEKFTELKASLVAYAEALGADDLINREVVGCMFLLLQVLENTMNHYEHISHPEKLKIADAHAELWNLFLERLSK